MDELRKGLSRCSVDPRTTDVERLVTHMDARNGGRGGALRYEEFVAAALDAQRTLTAQTLSNIFCERPSRPLTWRQPAQIGLDFSVT